MYHLIGRIILTWVIPFLKRKVTYMLNIIAKVNFWKF